ncbi:MAG: hypothetical protein KF819_06540 [Labilithrix sp.]|nr:hypothetical protein [Labilithrix sp.]
MRRALALGLVALALVIAASSCKEPTQVLVEVRTNVPYRASMLTSFTVGAPGETELAAPTTESRAPWYADGFVGSLAVVPRTSDDAALAVKVVLGVSRSLHECTPPKYEGCIVARRRVRYRPQEMVRLPISLHARCEGVACDELSTCNVLGLCVSAEVDPATCEIGCTVPGEPSSPPAEDAGADADASGVVDAPSDGASSDGPSDGRSDAREVADAPTEPVVSSIDCPPTVCSLASNGRCCYDADLQSGACAFGGVACPTAANKISVACDGPEDCPGAVCCASSPGTIVCQLACPTTQTVCHSTGTCPAPLTCTGLVGGHYKVCQ